MITTTIDGATLAEFKRAMDLAPKTLLKELAGAYAAIGRYDTDRIRDKVKGSFKVTSQGAANSFRFKATNAARATEFNKLFVDEYTRWNAADIFQTGGTIAGKGKNLTIITAGGRTASGRRKFTPAQIRNMIASKQARFIPTPAGAILVQITGGLTKKGKVKKGSGNQIVLGFLRRSVTEKKKLDFYEAQESAGTVHQEFMEDAIDSTFAAIGALKGE
jgi:hypothetical protein